MVLLSCQATPGQMRALPGSQIMPALVQMLVIASPQQVQRP